MKRAAKDVGAALGEVSEGTVLLHSVRLPTSSSGYVVAELDCWCADIPPNRRLFFAPFAQNDSPNFQTQRPLSQERSRFRRVTRSCARVCEVLRRGATEREGHEQVKMVRKAKASNSAARKEALLLHHRARGLGFNPSIK